MSAVATHHGPQRRFLVEWEHNNVIVQANFGMGQRDRVVQLAFAEHGVPAEGTTVTVSELLTPDEYVVEKTDYTLRLTR